MLHEMTHNIHGPHNAAFYKLLDELWEARHCVLLAHNARVLTSLVFAHGPRVNPIAP